MADSIKDDLEAESTASEETSEEREEGEDTGATPEEAHREGEFDDIVRRLDALSAKLDAVQSAIAGLIIDSTVDDVTGPSGEPSPDLADLDSWDI